MTGKKQWPRSFILICLVVVLAVLPGTLSAFSPSARYPARVIAVNDGDTVTIVMNGRQYRTRLIGFDAPEMGQEPWGERARGHLRKILKDLHWKVAVETGLEEYDKYNRLLVYFWSDKILVNELMVLDGYAFLFTMQPNSKYAGRLRDAQRIARQLGRGIWGPEGLKERPLDYKKKHPRQPFQTGR